jgi:hypothetical protein
MDSATRPEDCEIVVCCVDADAATGERLTNYLREQLGYKVAFYKEMPTGAHWTSVIRRQFDVARAVIVLHSKNSVGQIYVDDEVVRARAKGTYFPVLLDILSPAEKMCGDTVIQGIELDRHYAPTGQIKIKFDRDLDELVLGNSPESFQRIYYRLRFPYEKEESCERSRKKKPSWLRPQISMTRSASLPKHLNCKSLVH